MACTAEYVLHPCRLQQLARSWLLEDTSSFNFAGVTVESSRGSFAILVKSPGMLAGVPFARVVFNQLGLSSEWINEDGDSIIPVKRVAVVTGRVRNLFLAEQVVLSTLSRASGIATLASTLSTQLRQFGWKGHLAGTRKTTPGFRMVEKYALIVGGADCHRYDLSDMVMLKDNHLALDDSIKHAVERVRRYSGFSHKIEVECCSLNEALEAAEAGADIVMLDNFQKEELHDTAKKVKNEYPNILIEASGGVTEDNITDYASPYVDIISTSSLVQGYKTLDISIEAL